MPFNTSLSSSILADWAERAGQDAAYAWRGLRRSPGFTAAVVLVLALGLGANAAIFSVLDRVFLSPPAGVNAPQEIRRLYYIQPQSPFRAFEPANGVRDPMDYPEYAAIRASAERGVSFAAYVRPDSVETRIDNAVVPAMVSYVTQSFFSTLRVRPARGRFFTADEDRVDNVSPAAVISDAFWHRAFAGDSTVLGKQVRIAERKYFVVGIAQRDFSGIDLDRVDLWLPLGAVRVPPFWGPRPWYLGGFHVFRVIARVPSSIADQKVTAVATVAYRREQQSPNFRDTTSTIVTGPIVAALGPSERQQEVSISLRLAGVSLFLLLIAVGNVANLLLVRGMRRRREIAIRRALGVSTARLCWLLITESLLLSTLGAAAATIIAAWGSMALRALLLPEIHWSSNSHFAHVVAFTAVVSVVVGTLAGMAPVFHASGLDVTSALKASVRSGFHRRMLTRNALMIGQVALSVVLLVGAGLFVRSLRNVRAIDLGFDSEGLVAVHAGYLDLARSREVGVALENIATEMSRVPGVQHIAMASAAPMQGSMSQRLFLPGRDSVPTIDGIPPIDVLVSPEYFSTVGLRLVAGRTFESTDRVGMAPVAVVSRRMASVVWPGESAIGKCILTFARTGPCTTVVGVVDDVHTDDVVEARQFMQLYLPFAQNVQLDSLRFGARGIGRVILVRTRTGTEATVMKSALRVAREHLPGANMLRVNDMTEVLEPKLRPWRLGATLFSALGILAAVVAVVGMYSVIAYAASQRAHEMSVRMALGARAQDILALVAGEGLRVIFVSIVIGIGTAVVMGHLVASLLYGVSTRDPVMLVGAAALLSFMGLAAILTPALRAARSDPASALRAE
jgi:predicted permease